MSACVLDIKHDGIFVSLCVSLTHSLGARSPPSLLTHSLGARSPPSLLTSAVHYCKEWAEPEGTRSLIPMFPSSTRLGNEASIYIVLYYVYVEEIGSIT